jgi:hypothetical protein
MNVKVIGFIVTNYFFGNKFVYTHDRTIKPLQTITFIVIL